MWNEPLINSLSLILENDAGLVYDSYQLPDLSNRDVTGKGVRIGQFANEWTRPSCAGTRREDHQYQQR